MDTQGGAYYKHRVSSIYWNLPFANHNNQHQTHTYFPRAKRKYNPRLPFVICPHLYLESKISTTATALHRSICLHFGGVGCICCFARSIWDSKSTNPSEAFCPTLCPCLVLESHNTVHLSCASSVMRHVLCIVHRAWCPWMKHDAWCNLIPIHTHDLHEDAIDMITSTSLSI